ncbi:DUF3833 domain-containing protein [Halopseudomonas salina]|uniref:Lipoprotein n=1 Tax=Halopseudomonas salina TaxID=1323744 RepID=A0ABQ1P6Q3_9GAMM|nr:DUF3833 domain-containing protein [Halopseudomonas salina]GGC92251.1 lipoprotein [Halopseudomonas salina]
MRLIIAFVFALALAGCASPDVEHYANETPELRLQDYFNGELEAWGMFQKRDGELVRRFHVRMVGSWEGDTGVLDEYFTYSDGSTERRVWTLVKQSDGTWRGTADDVEGEAVGEVSGNAFHWRYTLRLKVDDSTWLVDFDDWMYLIDDKVMLNRATMSKWGVELGQVTLSFIKP